MDSKLIKHKGFPKTLLLKDYLLDDMSSCSSNGFKSFPRKQCCTTTVRFLIEVDLKNINQPKKYFIFNNSKRKPSMFSIQAIFAALRRRPLSAATGASPEKSCTLKKILKKSVFWKRKSSFDEISRWKSLHQLMKEGSESLEIPNSSIMAAAAAEATTISDSCGSSSHVSSSFSEVKRNDDDGGGGNHDDVEVMKDGEASADSTTSCDGGATGSSTKMQVSGEREQFSPVSVLDCPFHDDDDVSSPFQHIQGTRKKLMQKMKMFECLSQLEPLNLSKRFASEPGSPPSHSSSSIAISSITEEEDEVRRAEEKALDLLQKLMDTSPLSGLEVKLFLDLFRERIRDTNLNDHKHSFSDEVVEEAESWMRGGRIREAFLGWELQRNRQAYMKEMERSGRWRCLEKEIGEIGLELGDVFFDALFDELVVDISSTIAL